jgi:hypothetical protein
MNSSICTIAMLILCTGCTNTYLKPTTTCRPLSTFDAIIIVPINGDSAFVEEDRYRSLPHDLAIAITDQLKDQIENGHMFSRVLQSLECSGNAIKVDGKIYSLIHNRRQYHIGIRGQVINCKNGEILYKYDNDDEQDSEIIKLPRQIAERITNGIRAKLICETPK